MYRDRTKGVTCRSGARARRRLEAAGYDCPLLLLLLPRRRQVRRHHTNTGCGPCRRPSICLDLTTQKPPALALVPFLVPVPALVPALVLALALD